MTQSTSFAKIFDTASDQQAAIYKDMTGDLLKIVMVISAAGVQSKTDFNLEGDGPRDIQEQALDFVFDQFDEARVKQVAKGLVETISKHMPAQADLSLVLDMITPGRHRFARFAEDANGDQVMLLAMDNKAKEPVVRIVREAGPEDVVYGNEHLRNQAFRDGSALTANVPATRRKPGPR